MKISDILRPEKIIPEFKSVDKDSVINELIDVFKEDVRVNDIEEVRKSVLEREKIMSTGVGKGFAIPHGKSNGVDEIIAGFGKTKTPVDFAALDEEPVNLIFLLVGKENLVGPHIKLLSRISRMMNKDDFRDSLVKAKTADEIYSVFAEEEKKYFEIS